MPAMSDGGHLQPRLVTMLGWALMGILAAALVHSCCFRFRSRGANIYAGSASIDSLSAAIRLSKGPQSRKRVRKRFRNVVGTAESSVMNFYVRVERKCTKTEGKWVFEAQADEYSCARKRTPMIEGKFDKPGFEVVLPMSGHARNCSRTPSAQKLP